MNILKYWYKYTNKKKYTEVKSKEYDDKVRKKSLNRVRFYENELKDIILHNSECVKNKKELNFLHSGHLGDVIYSLPVIKKLAETHQCNLYIQENKPFNQYYHKHPSGRVFLVPKLVEKILPLLKEQKFLSKVEKYDKQSIDINLDYYRELPVDLCFLTMRWYFHLLGIQFDLSDTFLSVEKHPIIRDKIVIVRTFRVRNYFVDYRFLSKYDNLLFIGLLDEYEDLKKDIPQLEFYDCKDFLEMAQIIKSSRFFIGNQCSGRGA